MFTDMARDKGYGVLYGGYDQGVYTLPEAFVAAYEALAAEVAKGPGRTDPNEVAHLEHRAAATVAYGAGDQVITGHLRPALDRHLAGFTADVATLGGWAERSEPTSELLYQPEAVREAFLRHIATGQWYGAIRAAYRVLRRPDCADPAGVDSLLAEVANIADILPNWTAIGQHTSRGFNAPPWQGTAAHLRLGWLVRAGARIWLPTTVEHNQAWTRWQQTRIDAARKPAGSQHAARV